MTAVAALSACSDSRLSQQKNAASTATAFAEAYFNYDLTAACKLTTPETQDWLRFVASNINEEDIEVLNARSEGAMVTLTQCEMVNDTMCEAHVVVDNYLVADSIGRPLQLRHNDDYQLTLVLRDGRWQVRMADLPRSERHNHD